MSSKAALPNNSGKVALLVGVIVLALLAIVVFLRSSGSSDSGTVNPTVRQMKASVRGRHQAPTPP